jgi:hypothetical protein
MNGRYPGATWYGTHNDYPGGMKEYLGVVDHIEQGSEGGTIGWFQNPASEVSAHFAISKTGQVAQFVDIHDAAWAEVSGNPDYISVEHEGVAGDHLTAMQLVAEAHLIAWIHNTVGFTFTLADTPGERGLGYHAMGGVAWGDHPDCPGAPIVASRATVLAAAQALVGSSILPVPPAVPVFPLPSGYVFGPLSGPANVISGYRSYHGPQDLALWQRRMLARGWTIGVDGYYGPQTQGVAVAFARQVKQAPTGLIGFSLWDAAWSAPVVP